MKKELTKREAQIYLNEFFSQSSFTSEQVKKAKRIAMRHRIKLTQYRKSFCKKCLSPLHGKIHITKEHKTVICAHCGYENRFRLQ
ncbi:hypothetical protein HYZ97_03240 [Candidatus Pacearchaeota archaeon]|nr:hypothetical protein [Candidatus Pacearchaeota archaeon]